MTQTSSETYRPLRAGIVGGGQGAFIGAVHRIATELDGQARVIAGALPLLYDMGERIVHGATFDPDAAAGSGHAAPASGTRRSRQLEGVGYDAD